MQGPRSLVTSVTQGKAVVWPSIGVGVAVLVASLLVGDRRGDVRVDVAMVSMAAFLFGLLLAFTVVRTRERLARVQDLIAKGNSSLFSIHQMVAVFDEEKRSHVRELVDLHLVEQIDYRLVDNYRAAGSLSRLSDAVYALDPADVQQESVYKELLSLCSTMTGERSLIEAAVGQALSPLEWSGLLLLLLVLLSLLAVLPGGSVPGAAVVGMLAGALITLMILLRRLDLLRWHEQVTIWEPTTRLFRSMGRHPYVPRDVIVQRRYCPSGLVRVVDYPDPYPLRSTKIVTVENLGGVAEPVVAAEPVAVAEPLVAAEPMVAAEPVAVAEPVVVEEPVAVAEPVVATSSNGAGAGTPNPTKEFDGHQGAYRIKTTASDLLEKLLSSIVQATADPPSDGQAMSGQPPL